MEKEDPSAMTMTENIGAPPAWQASPEGAGLPCRRLTAALNLK